MIASRTAMDSGVNCDLINTMSGHYIEEISKSSTATDFAMVFADMFKSYTSQVAKLRQLASGSPLSHKIDSFIQSHLYEKLSPARIAEHLNMNCSYLCTHFKQTTGKTISAYIQECKIQEAIHLLECGNLSSPAISELLCFSSQSYFCAVFKKITGMTPQEYKKKFLTPAGSDV